MQAHFHKDNSMQPIIGRLAPSPTGALHLGNARSFLIAWLSVRSQNGLLFLRLEDIDSPRVKHEARESTLEDLRWLGLDWDLGPDRISNRARQHWSDIQLACDQFIQSNRIERYQQVLNELRAKRAVYPCICTRKDIDEANSAPHEGGTQNRISISIEIDENKTRPPVVAEANSSTFASRYPGTCRVLFDSGTAPAFAEGDRVAYRYRLDDSVVTWQDELLGKHQMRLLETLGDFVVAKRERGSCVEVPAYQLAVIVDDRDYSVNEVVRGNDLIASTFRQVSLLDQLGWERPKYYHLPLMIGEDGNRLAKRHGDTRLRWFRDQGVQPRQMLGYLAWTAGLLESPREVALEELVAGFCWSKIVKKETVVRQLSALKLMIGL